LSIWLDGSFSKIEKNTESKVTLKEKEDLEEKVQRKIKFFLFFQYKI
jgi:hypothetical protein